MPKKKASRKSHYDAAQLEREYNTLRPLLTQFESEIEHQLAQLLHRNVALAFPIQHRVKAWPSIAEKIQRVRLSIKELKELQDLVGFRIVLQFRRDIERVCTVIERTFSVLNRYDTVARLREDQFGYSSVHYVVELPAEWHAVPTMAGLAGLRAEIQVRTTAQHIWAEASQTLQYKNEKSVPPALKRSIYRVSALLETVDLEFERVLSDRDSYKAEVAQTVPPEETLNVETLQQVLDSDWPSANKDEDGEDYADLLTDLNALGVTTPAGLRKITSKWRDSVRARDAERVAQERTNPSAGTRSERIASGVFFTHVGLTRSALEMEFPQQYKEYFDKKWGITRSILRALKPN